MPSDPSSLNPLTVYKTCSACGTPVERADCHRNRYGEYICKACRARGVRFTWSQRWRRFKKRKGRKLRWTLIAIGVIALTLLLLFRFLDQVGP